MGVGAQGQNKWKISHPVFSPGKTNTFDEIAVKDPSVVFFEDKWHLFYTARSKEEYTTGYVNATHPELFNQSERHELKQIRGIARYGCAPQVFYFGPHKLWYLIFQNKDANYQPAFSTNTIVDNPKGWSEPKYLLKKEARKKWIDFWIIADQNYVYLFYTQAHGGVIMRKTTYSDFPSNWRKAKKVFDDVHEAVHIYKVKGKEEYHMLYEINEDGIRSFGLAKSRSLEGPWTRSDQDYACGEQLHFVDGEIWTDMVSHGEVIRSGYNQFMEYEPKNCRWLIQGIRKSSLDAPYPMLPWKLGIIEQINQ